jgi:hypothetical protein
VEAITKHNTGYLFGYACVVFCNKDNKKNVKVSGAAASHAGGLSCVIFLVYGC